MSDLKITYTNENNERVSKEYDTIMDFLDQMESDSPDISMLNHTDVKAVFFENPYNCKNFDTIEDLYTHCQSIVS